MSEQLNDQQLFVKKTAESVEALRVFLQEENPSLQLDDALQVVCSYGQIANGVEVGSFRLISSGLEKILLRHSTAQTTPNRIELETIELAVDWLEQLSILYEENLPEPKSLVAELLYTFDLVEHSQDAVSLAELVGQSADSRVDPFLDDPDFDVTDRPVPSHRDPFADDPGFGLEFDLLQRSINFVVESKNIETEEEEDPSNTTTIVSTTPSYDVFADDPPLSGEPNN